MIRCKCNSTESTHIKSSFKFDDKVEIKPLKVEGRVSSFWLKRENCLFIEVRYFMNNELKTDYFFEDELEVIKEKKTGF